MPDERTILKKLPADVGLPTMGTGTPPTVMVQPADVPGSHCSVELKNKGYLSFVSESYRIQVGCGTGGIRYDWPKTAFMEMNARNIVENT